MDEFKPFPYVFKYFNETTNTERKYSMLVIVHIQNFTFKCKLPYTVTDPTMFVLT